MNREEVKLGHTNKKYIEDNKFVIEKTHNGFNHKIDYKLLKEFNFVPKLIEDTKDKSVWEKIEGTNLVKPTLNELKSIGMMVRRVHKSDIKLPVFNLRRRAQEYLRILKEKYVKVPEIDRNYDEMFKLMSNMKHLNPCHNDIWPENLMKDKTGKIWLVDWEYATMGDKHFDLAYYIESARLTEAEEKTFLDAYNSLDDYNAYIEEWMPKYKKFVNWLTVLWAHAQDEMPFDLTPLKKKL